MNPKRENISDYQVCLACDDFHSGRSSNAPWRLLMERSGAPEKVVYAAMMRAEDRGLLEYGVSLRTAWLTSQGRGLLRAGDAAWEREDA